MGQTMHSQQAGGYAEAHRDQEHDRRRHFQRRDPRASGAEREGSARLPTEKKLRRPWTTDKAWRHQM